MREGRDRDERGSRQERWKGVRERWRGRGRSRGEREWERGRETYDIVALF